MGVRCFFEHTVIPRLKSSRESRCLHLQSALNELLNGDIRVAKSMLDHYLKAILDIEETTIEQKINTQLLQQLLKAGNSNSISHLTNLFRTIQNLENAQSKTKVQQK
jgi:hypothetical protein